MATTLSIEHLLLPEDCQQNILYHRNGLHFTEDVVWSFDPFIRKRLEGVQAKLSLVDRSFQILYSPGTEQSANYDDHSPISTSI